MRTSSNAWLVAIGAIVVALIALSVVIAVAKPGGGAQQFPASTPEGVLQRYLNAVQAREYALAHTYFSQRLRKACTVDDISRGSSWVAEGAGGRRIELVETKALTDGRTQVRVRVTEVSVSPPFGVNEFSHDEWYVLEQEGGSWRLDSLGWPVNWCPGLGEPGPRS